MDQTLAEISRRRSRERRPEGMGGIFPEKPSPSKNSCRGSALPLPSDLEDFGGGRINSISRPLFQNSYIPVNSGSWLAFLSFDTCIHFPFSFSSSAKPRKTSAIQNGGS